MGRPQSLAARTTTDGRGRPGVPSGVVPVVGGQTRRQPDAQHQPLVSAPSPPMPRRVLSPVFTSPP